MNTINKEEIIAKIRELNKLGIIHDNELNDKIRLANVYFENKEIKKKEFDKTLKPSVIIKNLTKQYKGRKKPAVNDISFQIFPGQFHAFIGANGAGKTTTIKSIISAYSDKKYKGEIKILGHKNDSALAKKHIGYIPEKAIFPKKINTFNYLKFMSLLSGYSYHESKKIATSILKKLDIESLAKKRPNDFSSGQKKKILLAQALINNPDILIMDEPAANLDPLARHELFEMLLSLQKEGKSIFISSHILDEIGKYATYATILDGGKIVFDGPLDNINNDLNSLYLEYVKLGSVDTQK